MRMYIPEIGDKIKLLEDWCFELHSESRNIDLAALYGYYITHFAGWIDGKVLPPMREIDYEVQYPDRQSGLSYDEYNYQCSLAEDSCPEYVKYWADNNIHSDKCRAIGKPTINIIIPAGTILKIDRIYIRKGAKDYSSITFYATGLGTVHVTPAYSWEKKRKKSSLRFWTKLVECNNIMFEKETN